MMNSKIPANLRSFIDQHLTVEEAEQISDQFSRSLTPNNQVLWTGMPRDVAQRWADENYMQTLTTAMGPLMAESHRLCPKRKKTKRQWTKYIHGASAVFALHISKGDVVTVLTQPPPARFHPSGTTSFQVIEEPIVKGKLGNRAVRRIDVVHPTVPGASRMLYQLWPKDQCSEWVSAFGNPKAVMKWRQVKPQRKVLLLETARNTGILPDDSSTPAESLRERLNDHKNESKALQGRQSRERQLLQAQEASKRQSLRKLQRQEIQSFQGRQTIERRNLGKKQRGPALHKKETEEMEKLQEKMRRQRASLHNEEVSRLQALKETHKRERSELQKRGTRKPTKYIQGQKGGGIKLQEPLLEDSKPQIPADTSALRASSVGSRFRSYIHFFVGSALDEVFGWAEKDG
jgi:hypothetical protein